MSGGSAVRYPFRGPAKAELRYISRRASRKDPAVQRVTRYAKSGDIHVAYQVFGEGPDLVAAPGFVSHVENYWEEPRLARWLSKLGGFCRVVLFDKRGTGLSDTVAPLPHMDVKQKGRPKSRPFHFLQPRSIAPSRTGVLPDPL
jgi:pimeloyl-ACP methyl ester carboxylesterase